MSISSSDVLGAFCINLPSSLYADVAEVMGLLVFLPIVDRAVKVRISDR